MSTAIEFAASAVHIDATACVGPCYAVSDGRYGALVLMCLRLQAEITNATTHSMNCSTGQAVYTAALYT